ncbi:pentatricopeptide repeat-containing protein At5g19020, mitochondrial [Dioscorea cayenensis subsp. rotundata]|uniref:Pentatricopeptide repeat-containing protein At5g19020, mitochondrial n=1 Tax=Dioscorea cayennensis subsp. rotundata TaxID=55577 RepID=A0AB40AK66_DIOCR|nr:pentatricopeptide repeat-containing protein At5g19020, mitochondrial [Dioscorea cayenensis subsp. rotundata]
MIEMNNGSRLGFRRFHPSLCSSARKATIFKHLAGNSSPAEFSLVAALKSLSTSLVSGQQLHAPVLKSGLDISNLFVRNGLINLYSKCGHVDDARRVFASSSLRDTASWNIMLAMHVRARRIEEACDLFDEMPDRDCVSFTTMIMGLAQSGRSGQALSLFRDMVVDGVVPNEVTLASVISACANLRAFLEGRIVHGVAKKCGLDAFVLVATNLVHLYATCTELDEARAIFEGMLSRNAVTWNAMLNGYAKAGRAVDARELFDEMPERDLVSWSTMIDGYLRADQLKEALFAFCEMRQDLCVSPNEVMLVNLVSGCGRVAALREGQQLHAVIVKTGLDCHAFLQSTVIHFYMDCQQIELACLQFSLGNKENISSWNALMAGFVRNGMIDSARRLFDEMTERDVVSWSTLITGYVHHGQSRCALDLFDDMRMAGVEPNEITLLGVLSAVASSGTLEQGEWIHNYIRVSSIPLTDNLTAGLIDMYAKHGSIENALQVFDLVRHHTKSVSPWNAVICGLAMHGHESMSLQVFNDLLKTGIKLNSITFIGVLTACCHAGLVMEGRRHFESMKSKYGIEPNIKHYGCMVDLLGRAGCLEETEQMIESMPIEADVVIWGSLLAACRIHGDVKIGERAAERLARLDGKHGAGRVLLSNIYANAGRWDDVFLVRRAMQQSRFNREPGCSALHSFIDR